MNPLDGAVPAGHRCAAAGSIPAIVDEFAKFAAYAGWKFGDQVDLWCTINEPVVVLVSGFVNAPGVGGNFPPGVFNFAAVVQAIPQLVAAHARALRRAARHGHASTPTATAWRCWRASSTTWSPSHPAQSGRARSTWPARRTPTTSSTASTRRRSRPARFDANLDGDTDDPGELRPDLAGRSDFLGVNYYLRATVDRARRRR